MSFFDGAGDLLAGMWALFLFIVIPLIFGVFGGWGALCVAAFMEGFIVWIGMAPPGGWGKTSKKDGEP